MDTVKNKLDRIENAVLKMNHSSESVSGSINNLCKTMTTHQEFQSQLWQDFKKNQETWMKFLGGLFVILSALTGIKTVMG